MPTLAEARAKLPQYAGLTDENLLGAIQRNFYPDKPLEAVAQHFGVKLAPPPAPEVASRSLGQAAGDTLVRGARGAVSGIKMFTDLAGANNPVSGALNDAQQGLGNMLSPQAQEIARQRSAAIDQANTSGSTWDQVKAYGGAFLDDPIGSTVEGIGSAVPTIAATLATGGAAPAASIAARGLPFVVGAAQGAGAVKGSIYEETKRELLKANVPAEEAEQRAVERQSYAMSGPQIAAGAGLGAVAGKLGESVIANPAAGGIRRRVITGAIQEAPTEAAQGAQEQYAVNTALNAEGLNVAPMRGVLGAGVAEGITGGAVGGAFGLARARTPGDEIRDANKVPEVGPLSRAENLGVESVAAKVDASVPVMPPVPAMPAMPAQAPEALTQAREPVRAPATPATPPLPPAPFPLDMVPEGQADPMQVLNRMVREDEGILRARPERRPAAPQVARQPEAGPPEPTIDEALSRMAAVQVEPPAPIEPPPYLDALAEKDQRDAQTRALYGTMGKPSPILNREGKPFTTRIAANRKAAEVGGEVEKVEGGFIVNPPTPADAAEVTPPASLVTTQAAPDVPGARAGEVEADGVDLSHLRALEFRLSNERERLDRAKSPSERRAREVTVRGILREIEGERKLLGIPDQQAQGAEDDALLDALGSTQEAPEPGAVQDFEREKWNLRQIREKSDRLGIDIDTDSMRSPALAATGWSAEKPKAAPEAESAERAEADGVSGAQSIPELGKLRAGKVGDKFASNEVVLTASGRPTTPFPAVKTDSERKTYSTLRAVDRWLLDNAAAEARARGDSFNAPVFEADAKLKNIPQASKDSAEEYLFGQQPAVVPSMLKPMGKAVATPAATPQAQAVTPAEGVGATRAEPVQDAADDAGDDEPDTPLGLLASGPDRKMGPGGYSFPADRIVTAVQRAFAPREVEAMAIGSTSDRFINFGGSNPDGRYFINSISKAIVFSDGKWGSPKANGGLDARGKYDQARLQDEVIRVLTEEGAKRRQEQQPAQPAEAATTSQGRVESEGVDQQAKSEDVPTFATLEDANDWIKQQAAKMGGMMRLSASPIYAAAWPQIKALSDADTAKTAAEKMQALKAAGLSIGDKVQMNHVGAFLTQTKYTGTIANRAGRPFVKIDGEMAVSRGGRVSYVKSVPWDRRWKKVEAEAPASESVAPQALIATHKDPGEPAEPVTPAVVRDAIRTAAENRDRPIKDVKADALRLIDEAIAKAPSEAEVLEQIGTNPVKTVGGKKEFTAVRSFGEDRDGSIVVKVREDKDGRWNVTNENYDGSGTGRKVSTKLGVVVGTPSAARDQTISLLTRLRPDGTLADMDSVSIKVPGDGEFKVRNTKERLAEFRKKVEASPGFKTQRPTPTQSDRFSSNTGRYNPNVGQPFGVENGSSTKREAIESMIDEGDPQAAVDYAAARGLDIAEVLKGDKLRLGKVAGLTPTGDAPNEAEAAPEPAAPPVAKQARPRVTRFVTKNDMVGSAVEWQEQGADGAWNRLTTFDTMEAAKSSAASQGYDAEAIPRFVSEFSTTAKRFLPAVPEPKAPTQPTPTSATPQAQQEAPNPQEQAAEPDALTLTPKQYHEARLRQMATDSGSTLAEIQEMYDTEGGRAESNVLWSKAVDEAARGGAVLTRQTIDKLLELNPTARLPESAIPAGYQRPEARKQEAEAKEAVRQDRREARAARQASPGAPDGATITRAQESALYDFLKQQIGDDSLRYELIAKKFRRAADGTASDEDAKITAEWLEGMRVDGDERQRLAAEGKAKAEADAADSERRAAEKSAESLADLRAGKAGNERYRLFLSTLTQAERDAKQSTSDFNVAFMSFIGARSGEFRRQQRSDQINDQDAFTAYIREWVSKRAQPATVFDQFKATMRAIYDGTASLEDYKAAYRRVRDADTVKAELNKLTKDDLIRTFGIMARPDEKKDSLVATAYKAMLRGFALGKQYGPTSYMMTRGGLENFEKQKVEALDAIVEGHTAEDLAAYAAEVAKERAEVSAKRAARAEAIADPKTLDDFRAFLNVKMAEGLSLADARRAMTLEQRAAYDALEAETTRERRERAKQADRQVRAAGQQVAGSIIETKHTRDGYPLFVVQLGERVSREDYMTLLASAKKLGGWYSSFRGSGAVPGFQFKARAEAEAFTALAGGDAQAAQEQAQARRDAFQDDKSQSAAERLTEMADRLEELADESLNRERKVNTQRRAGMAAAAEKEAREQKAFAATMRNLAEAITAGRAQFLDRVREKAQVGMLRRILANAKDAELRAKYPTYAEQEKRKGQPATVETVDYAEFPSFTAMRSDLASLARQLLEVDGTKKVGERLMKVADDVSAAFSEWVEKPGNWSRVARFVVKDTGQRAGFKSKAEAEAAIRRGGFRGKAMPWSIKRGEWTIITTPSEAIAAGLWEGDGDKRITLSQEFGQELVDTIGRRANKANRLSVPWQFETAADRLKALARMGIETPAEFRSALREFITMNEQAAEADRVKELERAMVGRRNDGLDFFPTPGDVADQMVEAAEIGPEMEVLEPSAGMGHIADRIRAAGAEPTVVEMAEDRRELLAAKGYRLDDARDFLSMEPRRFFTWGDVFRAPDGTEGVMMGGGGMGSSRVMLQPLQADGTPDARRASWHNRDELEGVSYRGTQSGYHRILMNPPFSDGRDIDHVRHAYTLLKPGGRIVALMGESAFTNQSKKATEFREWLESLGGTDEKLPAGSFMDPSLPVTTGANARMVVINKPDDAPAFSRTPTQTQPLAVQSAVDRITATWANAPKVNVVSSMQDPAVPEKVRAEDAKQRQGGAKGSPRGFFYEGEVYVVADAIRSEADVAIVMAHEALGHFGLRQTFGPGLGRVLDLIASSRPDLVSAKAKAYGLPVNVLQARRILAARGITGEQATAQAARMVKQARATAAEEVLAEMAEKRPNLGIVRRAVAAIRTWLRENIPGMADLKLSDAEIIRDFILPARQFVERGGAQMRGELMPVAFQRGRFEGPGTDRAFTETERAYGGRAAYDRARAAGQTKLTYGQWVQVRTPKFKAWFGDWEGLRAQQRLDAMEPVKVRVPDEWRGLDVASLRARVRDALDEMVRAKQVIEHPDVGPIRVGRQGAGKTLSEGRDPGKLLIAADLRGVLPSAVIASAQPDANQNIAGYAKLLAKVDVGGTNLVALFTLRVQPDGAWYYNTVAVQDPQTQTPAEAGAATDGPVRVATTDEVEGGPLLTSVAEFSRRPLARVNPATVSKATDPQTGEPMVVYHGTTGDFSEFKVGDGTLGRGIYLTTNSAAAGVYPAMQNMRARREGRPEGAVSVMPLYASAKNPLELTSLPASKVDAAKVKAQGYDGIILRGDDGQIREMTVFRPEQIKSATGNTGAFDGDNPDIRFSRTLGEAVSSAPESASQQGKAIFAEAVKRAAGMGRNRLDVALNLLTRRQITEVYGKDIPELATYNELVQQMDAEKNEVGASADKLADAWGKLKDAKELAELMHDATLAQTDPALPFESFARESAEEASARATKHKELAARYAALSDGAKAVYRGARDQYNDQYRKIKEAIRENVMRASMTPGQRASFLKRLDEDFFKSVRGVYFPLARFGDYMVNVRGQDGELVAHHRAETLNEAEALRATLMKQAEANGWKVGKVLKAQEFNARRDLAGKGFVGRVMDTLEQAKVSDEVVDAIGQLYLQSLPDLSWAKSGIHRKGTPGFSQDARRAFARNMFFGARHLARLRYADRMTDTLADMQARVNSGADDEAFDSVAAQKVVDHMNRRHDAMMNPQTHPLSTALTSLGFVWHLGLSPASAIVNLTQTAFVSAPLMGARFGWSKAAPAMLEAARLAAVNRNDLGRVLKGDELRAFKEAVNAGTIDVTQAHDLAGIAQGEDSGVLWKIRPVMKAASFLFHHAERLNRQTTFLAAYRLARAEGLDHEAAMQEATGQVYDGHFDYAASNRAMAMQGNVARVVLLFKQYAQAMIYTLSRQTYLSLKGLTPEERSKARKTLAGILAMHAAAAGVLGLPVVGPVLALASALGSEDDEPWDAEVALRNMLADSIGPKLADAVARGGSRLGPWDISGRTALNNLLIPDIQEGLEGARWYETMAVALMGPVMGIGLNAAKGLQDIAEGETLRGLESMVPAVARAPIKATRYATEGNVDRTGVVINDEISASGLIGQFIGFSPSEARRATEGRAAQMQFASRLQKRRGALMRAHVDAALMGDQEALAEARQDIDTFNRANPDYSIRPANLRQSMIARRRRIAQAEAGAYVPARIRDRAQEQGRFALTE